MQEILGALTVLSFFLCCFLCLIDVPSDLQFNRDLVRDPDQDLLVPETEQHPVGCYRGSDIRIGRQCLGDCAGGLAWWTCSEL